MTVTARSDGQTLPASVFNTKLEAPLLPSEFDTATPYIAKWLDKGGQWFNIEAYGASSAASAATNRAAIEAARNAAITAGGGTIFVPPKTYATEPFTLPNGTHIVLRGAGWTSRLNFPTDAGAGTYAIRWTGTWVNNLYSRIQDLWITGPDGTGTAVVGVLSAQMSGVEMERKTILKDVRIDGFYAGVAIYGNHQRMLDCSIRNNYYNVYFRTIPGGDPMEGSQFGDQSFINCDLLGARFASVAIGNNTGQTQVNWLRCHFGFSPYCFYRETGVTDGAFIAQSSFKCCDWEQWGNAAIYCEDMDPIDDVIRGTTFTSNQTARNSGATATPSGGYNNIYRIAAKPADYAIQIGTIEYSHFLPSNLLWAYPGAVGVCHFKNIRNSEWHGADLTFDEAVDTYGRPVFVPFDAASTAPFNSNWFYAKGRLHRIANPNAVGITAGQLVFVDNGAPTNRVALTATNIPSGVAMEAGTAGGTDRILVATEGDVTVTVGGAVSAGQYAKPDTGTAGRVVGAADFSDGPIVGYFLTAAAGAGNTATLRLRNLG